MPHHGTCLQCTSACWLRHSYSHLITFFKLQQRTQCNSAEAVRSLFYFSNIGMKFVGRHALFSLWYTTANDYMFSVGVFIREVADSRTSGIFIQDTAVEWITMKICCIPYENVWRMGVRNISNLCVLTGGVLWIWLIDELIGCNQSATNSMIPVQLSIFFRVWNLVFAV